MVEKTTLINIVRVEETGITWGQFHMFTQSFYMPRSQKRKKTFESSESFCAFGIFLQKKLLVRRW